jgi:small-conductance mechanosensitive channel/CRP-like cAMP-binding protein
LEVFLYLASLSRSVLLMVTDGLRRGVGISPPRIVLDLIQGAVFISIALLALDASGVEPTSLLATSAVLTAVLGLSLQETLGNLFAGLAIQGEQPFQIGDWIQYDQTTNCAGRVVEINWRATKIETSDRILITVPNGVLARAPIFNYSGGVSYCRRHVLVDVPYECPAGVAEILANAARSVDGVLEYPAPDAVIFTIAESSIRYQVRFYLSQHSRLAEISGSVLATAIAALGRNHISIPYPVRRLEVRRHNATEDRSVSEAHRARSITQVPFVKVLPVELQQELVAQSYVLRFAKNEAIFRQNEEGGELYLITHGRVRVEVDTGERVALLATLGQGEFFGEMSLLTGDPRTASVFADCETEVLVLGHQALRTVIEKDPASVEAMAPEIAKRQNELSEQLAHVGSVYPREPTQLLTARIRSFFRP